MINYRENSVNFFVINASQMLPEPFFAISKKPSRVQRYAAFPTFWGFGNGKVVNHRKSIGYRNTPFPKNPVSFPFPKCFPRKTAEYQGVTEKTPFPFPKCFPKKVIEYQGVTANVPFPSLYIYNIWITSYYPYYKIIPPW
jgi:hypothetical protein